MRQTIIDVPRRGWVPQSFGPASEAISDGRRAGEPRGNLAPTMTDGFAQMSNLCMLAAILGPYFVIRRGKYKIKRMTCQTKTNVMD